MEWIRRVLFRQRSKRLIKKTGNTADINLLLVSMLNYAKLNASPILLSTRSNGIPIFPSRNGFNYVITGVELSNGSVVLLDATNKNAVPNIIPENTLNWFGRIVRKMEPLKW